MSEIAERYEPTHRLIRDLFTVAIAAVDPAKATRAVLGHDGTHLTIGGEQVRMAGRVVVVGMGKAATRMACATEQALGDRIRGGLVVTKDGHRQEPLPSRIEVTEAAHPLPDERSLVAGDRLLDVVGSAGSGDVVIALISGGGSSLAEALRPPLTLADLRSVTDLLLRAGATIGELNTVRRPLSRLKAGGLLAASRAPVYPLILSDVIGNDLGVIASGAAIPGAPVASQAEAALVLLDRFGLAGRVPRTVLGLLNRLILAPATASEQSLPPIFIGDNARSVSAIVDAGERLGLHVSRPPDWQGRQGEAADLGAAFSRLCQQSADHIDLVVGGGEATVTVRGDGAGGRNTEFALSAAIALEVAGDEGGEWVVASLATDGEDALTGAAGAIADPGTVGRIRTGGLDPVARLRQNDSLPCFVSAGGLVVTGPTGTNVNDLYIGVRVRRSDGRPRD